MTDERRESEAGVDEGARDGAATEREVAANSERSNRTLWIVGLVSAVVLLVFTMWVCGAFDDKDTADRIEVANERLDRDGEILEKEVLDLKMREYALKEQVVKEEEMTGTLGGKEEEFKVLKKWLGNHDKKDEYVGWGKTHSFDEVLAMSARSMDEIEVMRSKLDDIGAMNLKEAEDIAQGYGKLRDRLDNIASTRLRLKYEARQDEALRSFDERAFDYDNLHPEEGLLMPEKVLNAKDVLERIKAFK